MTRKKTPHPQPLSETEFKKLEIVIKCDVAGTEEAIRSSLAAIQVPGVEIAIIQSGMGNISKSDILMAQTGSRLVLGFNVDIMPKLQSDCNHQFFKWGKNEHQFRLHDSGQQR